MPRKSTKPKVPKPPKNPLNKLAKFVVSKYVFKGQIDWARDVKIANTLVAKYPSLVFWEMLPCRKQMNSLACLLTPKAQTFLKTEWLKFSLEIPPKPEEYKLESCKVGDDLPIQRGHKPRSLLEFCR